ncbi:hypothetical protein A8C32_07285 [Flavivirga aquatica]|uniref:Peptidase S74 domain-containing protein n=1 Tax=Flavivirga aquatica TaxID=1849968 RepID=A0A1E5SIN1_9FLAO|nr:hypothetical protein [Flavivirga aquatica]OEJ98978.1 hypothetical protein A8C32_07285 [Flavivirga aquatica]
MKKLFLFSVLTTTLSYAQVTDENGTSANGSGSTNLTGNIGIGITPSSSSLYKLEVNGTLKATIGEFTNSVPDGTIFNNFQDVSKASRVLAAGTQFTPNSVGFSGAAFQIYDFPQSNLSSKSMIWMGLEDRNNMGRYRFFAEAGGKGELVILNKNQSEIFKLNEDGSDNVFIHMPKTNSRMVIAGYGNYLPEHKFVVKSGSAMVEGNILTNSNLGIGTNSFIDGSDTYRLSVEGKVRAHAVKVYTDWADYVFEADYKLQTLNEVENYINKNGHLKGIPSAKEVEANGIELGEMNKLLLQKIEELTLYTIELKKELDLLKTKIE